MNKLIYKYLVDNFNENIIFHPDVSFAFKRSDPISSLNYLFEALRQYCLKKNKLIITPSFNFEFNKTKIFDVVNSRSNFGLFSNYILKYEKNFERSLHPLFSFIIIGNEKKIKYLKKNEFLNGFGKKSLFDHLYKDEISSFHLNCNLHDAFSSLLYFETKFKVPYRSIKKQKGTILDKKKKFQINASFYARKDLGFKRQISKIEKLIEKKDILKRCNIKNYNLIKINLNNLEKILFEKIKKNPYFLVRKKRINILDKKRIDIHNLQGIHTIK